jgi:hypothetical protein
MQAFEHDIIYEYISRRHNLTITLRVPNLSILVILEVLIFKIFQQSMIQTDNLKQ